MSVGASHGWGHKFESYSLYLLHGDHSSAVEPRIVVPVVVGSNPTGHPKNHHIAPTAQLNERGSPAGKNQPCGASCFVDSFYRVRFRLAASAAVRVRPASCCPGQQLGGRMRPCKSACSEILRVGQHQFWVNTNFCGLRKKFICGHIQRGRVGDSFQSSEIRTRVSESTSFCDGSPP